MRGVAFRVPRRSAVAGAEIGYRRLRKYARSSCAAVGVGRVGGDVLDAELDEGPADLGQAPVPPIYLISEPVNDFETPTVSIY